METEKHVRVFLSVQALHEEVAMTGAEVWETKIVIQEEGRESHAEATLSGKGAQRMVGHGSAKCNPLDENVPVIGDELAAARALSDLSHQLMRTAKQDIEEHTHQPVRGLWE
nr:DUF1876 domain-containing protein [Streptomyces sp. UNOC14_S4]